MRKRETIKIDAKEITVKELTVQEILEEMNGLDDDPDLEATLRSFLRKALDGIDFEGLKQLAPSELEEIWEVFKKVNAPFFRALDWSGLGDMLQKMRERFMTEWSEQFLISLKQAIPGSWDTAGPGLCGPAKTTGVS